MKAPATATVVVTNPTHYAIALRYEVGDARADSGRQRTDLLAEKIKQLARESGHHADRKRPLAQALYKSVEVGDSIPAKLYQAVAEILAIVSSAQRPKSDRREAGRRLTERVRSENGASGPSSTTAGGTRMIARPGRSDAQVRGVDCAYRCGLDGLRHAGAVAQLHPGSAAHRQHHRVDAGAAHRDPGLAPCSSRSFRVCCCCSRCFGFRSIWPARGAFCCTATKAPRLQAR